MKKFFDGVTNLSELKKAYREAAFANHPDRGGDAETMKEINAEYDRVFAELKAQEQTEHNQREHGTGETIRPEDIQGDDGYRVVIEALLHVDGLVIELCGGWLWITGATKEHKDEIKAAGCYWAPKKRCWYWRPNDYKAHHNRKAHSMAYIRDKYGSSTVGRGEHREQLPV